MTQQPDHIVQQGLEEYARMSNDLRDALAANSSLMQQVSELRGENRALIDTQIRLLAERDILVAGLNTANLRIADSHRFYQDMAMQTQHAVAIARDVDDAGVTDLTRRLTPPTPQGVQQVAQQLAPPRRKNGVALAANPDERLPQ